MTCTDLAALPVQSTIVKALRECYGAPVNGRQSATMRDDNQSQIILDMKTLRHFPLREAEVFGLPGSISMDADGRPTNAAGAR